MRCLIMAGGTGGHVYPALAVASALRDQGHEVHWLGTRGGFEARAVPQAGYEIAWLDVSGVRGKRITELMFAPLKIVRAVCQAWKICRDLRPALVVGMGGYASGPGGVAAWLLRIPLLIHEQNARAGTTNRILSRLASVVLQAYPDTFAARRHPITVGNPVRDELSRLPEPALREVGKRRPPHLLVLGGSQGARSLNVQVPKALARLEASQRPRIRHQSGRTHEQACESYRLASIEASISPFIEDMAEAYNWADLVICRAGALTLAELAAVGVGAIMVPFPAATDDHQTHNARHLVAAGAGELLPDSPLDPERLAELLSTLLPDETALREMATAARSCARPAATDEIVAQCLQLGEPS